VVQGAKGALVALVVAVIAGLWAMAVQLTVELLPAAVQQLKGFRVAVLLLMLVPPLLLSAILLPLLP
jgi:hypothetical protein